jgi:hypothetical protein
MTAKRVDQDPKAPTRGFATLLDQEAVGSYRGDPLYHASLDHSEYETLIAGAGFQLMEHLIHDPARGGRIVWIARRR